MSSDTIIMIDSSDAASIQTVTGWVSRRGIFCGQGPAGENAARYDGCTHRPCEDCGTPVEKSHCLCASCTGKKEVARYNGMPRVKWDGVSMVYSEWADLYFSSPADAQDFLDDTDEPDHMSIADLRLVICVPVKARKLDPDYFDGHMPENDDAELPKCLLDAIDAFNAAVDASPVLSWVPGKFALEIN